MAPSAIVALCLLALASAAPQNLQNFQCAKSCDPARQATVGMIGKTYSFNYNVQSSVKLVGVNEGVTQGGFTGTVDVSRINPCEIAIKFTSTNEAVKLNKFPLVVSIIGDGQFEKVCSHPDDDSESINIKKGIASAIQYGLPSFGPIKKRIVPERSVLGTCPTAYSIENNGKNWVVNKEIVHSECQDHFYSQSEFPSILSKSPMPLQVSKSVCTQVYTSNKVPQTITCKDTKVVRPAYGAYKYIEATQESTLQFTSESTDMSVLNSIKGHQLLNKKLSYDHSMPAKNPALVGKLEAVLGNVCKMVQGQGHQELASTVNKAIELLRHVPDDAFVTVLKKIRAGGYCADYAKLEALYMDAIAFISEPGALKVIAQEVSAGRVTGGRIALYTAALHLLAKPTHAHVVALSPVAAMENPASTFILAAASVVNKHCTHFVCENHPDVNNILNLLTAKLANQCTPAFSKSNPITVITTLKALGNIGHLASEHAEKIINCAKTEGVETNVRFAAAMVLKGAPCKTHVKRALLDIVLNKDMHTEVRIGSYLATIKCANEGDLQEIIAKIMADSNKQVHYFVLSHLNNLKKTSWPIKAHLQKALVNMNVPAYNEWNIFKHSRNIEMSFNTPILGVGAAVDSNVVFTPESYIPRLVNLGLDMNLLGSIVNIGEVGARVEGFDPIMKDVFGPGSYLHKTPLSEIIKDTPMFIKQNGANILNKLEKIIRQNKFVDMKSLIQSVAEFLKVNNIKLPKMDLHAKLMGQEYAFLSLAGPMQEVNINHVVEIITSAVVDALVAAKDFNVNTARAAHFQVHYAIPTIQGVPLKINLDSTAVTGIQVQSKLDSNYNALLKFIPSVSIAIEGHIGFGAIMKHGLKMKNAIYSTNGLALHVNLKNGQDLELKLELPEKMELINVKSEVYQVTINNLMDEQKIYPRNIKDARVAKKHCSAVVEPVTGLQICFNMNIPDILKSDSLPLGMPAQFSIHLQKSDVEMKGYRVKAAIKNKANTKVLQMIVGTYGSASSAVACQFDVKKVAIANGNEYQLTGFAGLTEILSDAHKFLNVRMIHAQIGDVINADVIVNLETSVLPLTIGFGVDVPFKAPLSTVIRKIELKANVGAIAVEGLVLRKIPGQFQNTFAIQHGGNKVIFIQAMHTLAGDILTNFNWITEASAKLGNKAIGTTFSFKHENALIDSVIEWRFEGAKVFNIEFGMDVPSKTHHLFTAIRKFELKACVDAIVVEGLVLRKMPGQYQNLFAIQHGGSKVIFLQAMHKFAGNVFTNFNLNTEATAKLGNKAIGTTFTFKHENAMIDTTWEWRIEGAKVFNIEFGMDVPSKTHFITIIKKFELKANVDALAVEGLVLRKMPGQYQNVFAIQLGGSKVIFLQAMHKFAGNVFTNFNWITEASAKLGNKDIGTTFTFKHENAVIDTICEWRIQGAQVFNINAKHSMESNLYTTTAEIGLPALPKTVKLNNVINVVEFLSYKIMTDVYMDNTALLHIAGPVSLQISEAMIKHNMDLKISGAFGGKVKVMNAALLSLNKIQYTLDMRHATTPITMIDINIDRTNAAQTTANAIVHIPVLVKAEYGATVTAGMVHTTMNTFILPTTPLARRFKGYADLNLTDQKMKLEFFWNAEKDATKKIALNTGFKVDHAMGKVLVQGDIAVTTLVYGFKIEAMMGSPFAWFLGTNGVEIAVTAPSNKAMVVKALCTVDHAGSIVKIKPLVVLQTLSENKYEIAGSLAIKKLPAILNFEINSELQVNIPQIQKITVATKVIHEDANGACAIVFKTKISGPIKPIALEITHSASEDKYTTLLKVQHGSTVGSVATNVALISGFKAFDITVDASLPFSFVKALSFKTRKTAAGAVTWTFSKDQLIMAKLHYLMTSWTAHTLSFELPSANVATNVTFNLGLKSFDIAFDASLPFNAVKVLSIRAAKTAEGAVTWTLTKNQIVLTKLHYLMSSWTKHTLSVHSPSRTIEFFVGVSGNEITVKVFPEKNLSSKMIKTIFRVTNKVESVHIEWFVTAPSLPNEIRIAADIILADPIMEKMVNVDIHFPKSEFKALVNVILEELKKIYEDLLKDGLIPDMTVVLKELKLVLKDLPKHLNTLKIQITKILTRFWKIVKNWTLKMWETYEADVIALIDAVLAKVLHFLEILKMKIPILYNEFLAFMKTMLKMVHGLVNHIVERFPALHAFYNKVILTTVAEIQKLANKMMDLPAFRLKTVWKHLKNGLSAIITNLRKQLIQLYPVHYNIILDFHNKVILTTVVEIKQLVNKMMNLPFFRFGPLWKLLKNELPTIFVNQRKQLLNSELTNVIIKKFNDMKLMFPNVHAVMVNMWAHVIVPVHNIIFDFHNKVILTTVTEMIELVDKIMNLPFFRFDLLLKLLKHELPTIVANLRKQLLNAELTNVIIKNFNDMKLMFPTVHAVMVNMWAHVIMPVHNIILDFHNNVILTTVTEIVGLVNKMMNLPLFRLELLLKLLKHELPTIFANLKHRLLNAELTTFILKKFNGLKLWFPTVHAVMVNMWAHVIMPVHNIILDFHHKVILTTVNEVVELVIKITNLPSICTKTLWKLLKNELPTIFVNQRKQLLNAELTNVIIKKFNDMKLMFPTVHASLVHIWNNVIMPVNNLAMKMWNNWAMNIFKNYEANVIAIIHGAHIDVLHFVEFLNTGVPILYSNILVTVKNTEMWKILHGVVNQVIKTFPVQYNMILDVYNKVIWTTVSEIKNLVNKIMNLPSFHLEAVWNLLRNELPTIFAKLRNHLVQLFPALVNFHNKVILTTVTEMKGLVNKIMNLPSFHFEAVGDLLMNELSTIFARLRNQLHEIFPVQYFIVVDLYSKVILTTVTEMNGLVNKIMNLPALRFEPLWKLLKNELPRVFAGLKNNLLNAELVSVIIAKFNDMKLLYPAVYGAVVDIWAHVIKPVWTELVTVLSNLMNLNFKNVAQLIDHLLKEVPALWNKIVAHIMDKEVVHMVIALMNKILKENPMIRSAYEAVKVDLAMLSKKLMNMPLINMIVKWVQHIVNAKATNMNIYNSLTTTAHIIVTELLGATYTVAGNHINAVVPLPVSVPTLRTTWTVVTVHIPTTIANTINSLVAFIDTIPVLVTQIKKQVTVFVMFVADLIPVIAKTVKTHVPQLINAFAPLLNDFFEHVPIFIIKIQEHGTVLVMFVAEQIPVIVKTVKALLPNFINDLIPVINEWIELLMNTEVAKFLKAKIPVLVKRIMKLVNTYAKLIAKQIPIVVKMVKIHGLKFINGLVPALNNFIENIPVFIKELVPLLNNFIKNIPTIVKMVKTHVLKFIKGLVPVLNNFIENILVFINELVPLLNNFIANIPVFIAKIKEEVTVFVKVVAELIPVIVKTVKAYVPAVIKDMVPVLNELIELLLNTEVVKFLMAKIPVLVTRIMDHVNAYVKLIAKHIPIIVKIVLTHVQGLINELVPVLNNFVENIPIIVKMVKTRVLKFINELVPVLNEWVAFLLNADVAKLLLAKIEEVIKMYPAQINAIKVYLEKFFGIAVENITLVFAKMMEIPIIKKIVEFIWTLIYQKDILTIMVSSMVSASASIINYSSTVSSQVPVFIKLHTPSVVSSYLSHLIQ